MIQVQLNGMILALASAISVQFSTNFLPLQLSDLQEAGHDAGSSVLTFILVHQVLSIKRQWLRFHMIVFVI